MERNMTIAMSYVLCKAVSSGIDLLCVLLDQAVKQQWNQFASCIIKPAYGHLVTTPEMVKLRNALETKCWWLPVAGRFLRSWMPLSHKKSSAFCGTGYLLTFAEQPETDLKLKPCPFHNFAYSIFISVLALNFRTLLGFSSGLLLSAFPNNISYMFVTATMRATCSNSLIILYFITVITFRGVKNYF